VRQQIDADAERADLVDRFEHARANAGGVQRKRAGQPGDTGADDQRFVAWLGHAVTLASKRLLTQQGTLV
jgi:hypothetical protein